MAFQYLNPESLLPKNDFVASGPLGGMLAGLQTMYGLGGLNAANRDQDLSYLENLNKYETTLKDQPLKDLQREVETAKAGDLLSLYKDGKSPASLAYEKERADTELTTNKAEVLKRVSNAEEVDAAYKAMSQADLNGELGASSTWDFYRKKLQRKGIENLPSIWGAEAKSVLSQHWKASQAFLKQYQEMAIEERKAYLRRQAQMDVEGMRHEAQMELEKLRQKGQKEVATIRGEKPDRNNAAAIRRLGAISPEDRTPQEQAQLKLAVGMLIEEIKNTKAEDLMQIMQVAASQGKKVTPDDVEKVFAKGLNPFLRAVLDEQGVFKQFADSMNADIPKTPTSGPIKRTNDDVIGDVIKKYPNLSKQEAEAEARKAGLIK